MFRSIFKKQHQTIKDYLFELVMVGLGIGILFSPPINSNFGWHYKYGEYFWQHLKVLTHNTFSYTFVDKMFISPNVLAEIVNYFLYSHLGIILGSVIPAALLSITLLLFAKKIKVNNTSVFIWFLILATSLNLFQISVRPILYSTIFLYILLATIFFDISKQKYLPILFFIWANTNSDVAIGILIYGFYSFEQLFKKEYLPIKLLVISFLATFVNLNVVGLWINIVEEIIYRLNTTREAVNTLTGVLSQATFFVFGSIFAITGLLSIQPKDKWYKITLAVCFIAGIKSVEVLRIAYILGSVGLLYSLEPLSKSIEKHLHFWVKNIFTLVITYTIIIITVFHMIAALDTKTWTTQKNYPYEAVRFLENEHLTGNIFNNIDWGGYIIWKLPKTGTFIDGRMISWKQDGKYIIEDYYKITRHPETSNFLFNTYIQKYNIRYVLDRPDSTLVKYLSTQQFVNWRLIFIDENAVVLEKKD